jgi:hypothetical protein
MNSCASFAKRLAEEFPRSLNALPKKNWLISRIRSISHDCQLARRKILITDWDSKKALTPEFSGMFITRVALLLASDQRTQAENLIKKIPEEQKYKLAGEASLAIRCCELDVMSALADNSLITLHVATAILIAGYYTILLLAGEGNSVPFPISDRIFYGRLTPALSVPCPEPDSEGTHTFYVFVASRIEAFARISAVCTVSGALPQNVDPSDLFSDDVLTIPCMLMSMFVSKIPLLQRPKSIPPDNIYFLEMLKEVARNAFAPLEETYLRSLPQNLPSAHEIRKEAIQKRVYDIWPGISEIRCEENLLKNFTLLPMPDKTYMAVFSFTGKVEEIPVNYERLMEIPALDDETSWAEYEREARDIPLAGLKLSPCLEAIRMCVAPTQLKIRDKRVPSGFVSGSRRSSSKRGDVSVIYLPKIKAISAENNGHISSRKRTEPTGITHKGHQVACFIRQLHINHKASDSARTNASAYGITLPESGFTFVRPHMRGEIDNKRIFKVRVKTSEGAALE